MNVTKAKSILKAYGKTHGQRFYYNNDPTPRPPEEYVSPREEMISDCKLLGYQEPSDFMSRKRTTACRVYLFDHNGREICRSTGASWTMAWKCMFDDLYNELHFAVYDIENKQ